MSDTAAAVDAFFKIYNPPRAGSGAKFLAGYRGQEPAALAALDKEYKCKYFEVRRQLLAIFAKHDTGKLATLDALLAKYSKREPSLLDAVKRKYAGTRPAGSPSGSPAGSPAARARDHAGSGKEKDIAIRTPASPPGSPTGVRTPKAPEDGFLSAVRAFFTLYDKGSLAKAPSLVEKFRARREDFCYSLDKKYDRTYFALRSKLLKLNALSGKEPVPEAKIDAFMVNRLGRTPPVEDPVVLAEFKKVLEAQPLKQPGSPRRRGDGGPGGERPIDWTARIAALYKVYDPPKASNAKSLVAKYEGKEVEVWKQLVKRYGPEPEWEERLSKLVAHNKATPDRKQIATRLVEYAGREPQLLLVYTREYGPEPPGAARAAAAAAAGGGAAVASKEVGRRRSGGSPASTAPYANLPVVAKVYLNFWSHAREKLGVVHAMLAKHAGQEARLLDAVEKKQGVVPFKDATPANPPPFYDRMAVVYAQHAPEKLESLPAILVKYEGNEAKLMEATLKKYNAVDVYAQESAAGDGGDMSMMSLRSGGGIAASDHPPADRVKNMYRVYQPGKMRDVPGLLRKYKGKEEALIKALVQKYGPEPPFEPPPPQESRDVHTVKKYYMCYRPKEYGFVNAALDEFAGRERDLLAMLQTEYGELPPVWGVRALEIWETEYPDAPPPRPMQGYMTGGGVGAPSPGALAPRGTDSQANTSTLQLSVDRMEIGAAVSGERTGNTAAAADASTASNIGLGSRKGSATSATGETPQPQQAPPPPQHQQQLVPASTTPPQPRVYFPGEFRFLHEARVARWDIEDDEHERHAAMVLSATNARIVARQSYAQRLVAARSIKEHLGLAYKRWLGYLSWRISAVCDLRDVLYDQKLSVYNQIQTNKFSLLAHQRQERSVRQREARRKREEGRALKRIVDDAARRSKEVGVKSPRDRGLPGELALYRHMSKSPPFSPPPGKGARSEWDVAKSTAELALEAEDRRRKKKEAVTLLDKMKEDAEAKAAAEKARRPRSRTPRLRQQLPRDYHLYASPRTSGPMSTPQRLDMSAATASPTVDDVHDERVRSARRLEYNAYTSPDAMFYARTMQRATLTGETGLERELRRRKERARDFPAW